MGPRAGAEILAPTGIRSPDRPARSQSLYRLNYSAHLVIINITLLAQDKSCFATLYDRS
jgi:hypothetical protein